MSVLDDQLAALVPMLGSDWVEGQRAERAAERERMTALRARLLAAARAVGAATITAHYEGGNDNGAIDEITAEPAEADAALASITVETPQQVYDTGARAYVTRLTPLGFIAAATEFIGWIVTEQHGNWWDGDIETSGEVTWHVADTPDRIAGEHNVTVRTSERSEWEEEPHDHDDGVVVVAAVENTPAGAAVATPGEAADAEREG